MSELPRLHEEPESELERSLLSAGRSYSASAGTRAKTLAALGIVGAAATTSTAAASIGKAGVVKWLAVTALVVGAAVPAVHYLLKRAPSVAVPSTAPPAPASRSTIPIPDNASTSAQAPQPALAPPVNSTSPANSPVTAAAPPAMASTAKPVASAQGLSAELAALDSARSALAGGDPGGALVDLDAYARNFPHAKLGLEAEVLRIDALAKSGQTAAAQKRAQAFIKRHPDSVLASRVRAYAGQ